MNFQYSLSVSLLKLASTPTATNRAISFIILVYIFSSKLASKSAAPIKGYFKTILSTRTPLLFGIPTTTTLIATFHTHHLTYLSTPSPDNLRFSLEFKTFCSPSNIFRLLTPRKTTHSITKNPRTIWTTSLYLERIRRPATRTTSFI